MTNTNKIQISKNVVIAGSIVIVAVASVLFGPRVYDYLTDEPLTEEQIASKNQILEFLNTTEDTDKKCYIIKYEGSSNQYERLYLHGKNHIYSKLGNLVDEGENLIKLKHSKMEISYIEQREDTSGSAYRQFEVFPYDTVNVYENSLHARDFNGIDGALRRFFIYFNSDNAQAFDTTSAGSRAKRRTKPKRRSVKK